MELGDQPAEPLGAARIGLGAEARGLRDENVEGLEEALGARALIGELGGGLLPGAVELAEPVAVRHQRILEQHLERLRVNVALREAEAEALADALT